MPFRLRKDTRKWFRSVEDEFELDFDMYYLCLLAGLSKGVKEKLDNQAEDTTRLVENFPGDYKSKGRLITSLFLSRELQTLAIDFSNRERLHEEISRLVDSLSASRLTPEGLRRMNEYSYGGFEVLTEWFDDRPRSLEVFLLHFSRYLRQSEAERQ